MRWLTEKGPSWLVFIIGTIIAMFMGVLLFGCHQPKSDPRLAEAHRYTRFAWERYGIAEQYKLVIDFADLGDVDGLSWFPNRITFDSSAPQPPWPRVWRLLAFHECHHQADGVRLGWLNLVWMYPLDPERFETLAWEMAYDANAAWRGE